MSERLVEALLDELTTSGVRLELAPFRALLAALGDPQMQFPAVLVAGTNGKGSVSSLVAAIARAAGLRVGLYTSPHLESWSERIRIDDSPIELPRLAQLLARTVEQARADALRPPTPFEAITAAAFLEFGRAKVDLGVVEVGMGGRLDATNLSRPVITVATRIALDHRTELGETLVAIAGEKAGILRRGVPFVLAPQESEAEATLLDAARRLGAPLHSIAEECHFLETEWLGLDGLRATLRTPAATYALGVPLAGEHQLDNLRTAVRAAELLSFDRPAIDGAAIVAGCAAVSWPGRLESFCIPGRGVTVLLDAAHNPDGCAALESFLRRLDRPFDLVFGCLADKDADAMLARLVGRTRRLILTRPNSPRALAPQTLAELAGARDRQPLVEPSAPRALSLALHDADDVVVVAGSIYLVGELRPFVRRLARPAES